MKGESEAMEKIIINDAYQNNLKHISLELPKGKFIVFSGLSGSGKSTLALDTLQRECQRQYMESMGMTMEIGTKPKVGSIEGLSPAISINQLHVNRSPRSTAGTITEITPYLRVLFEKLGKRENAALQEDDIEFTADFFSYNKPAGSCPACNGVGVINQVDENKLIDWDKSIVDFAIEGWDQVYVDRYGASIQNAAKHYGFDIRMDVPVSQYNEVQRELLLYGVLSPQLERRFPDIQPPKTVPAGRFEGVVTNMMRRYEEQKSVQSKKKLEKYMILSQCHECGGIRFRKEVLEVKLQGKNIYDVLQMPINDVLKWLLSIRENLTTEESCVVEQLLEDIVKRTKRIVDVGAGYLCLGQPSSTISPGEIQRIKLASILGSGLTGVLYVLDEPSTGLHKRDVPKIIETIKQLRDKGNTVIVIEHNLDIIGSADYIVDFGPGSGKNGGEIVATGDRQAIINCKESITGKYLSRQNIGFERTKRRTFSKYLSVKNACANNLKHVNAEIPLESFVTIEGVSGAGKTSLVFGEIAAAAEEYFENPAQKHAGRVTGFENVEGVVVIDQASIGKSARSNVATYTDVFTDVRNLFALKAREANCKLEAKHFSYNVPGGRCENCEGTGSLVVSMNFLPDIEVVCPVCKGQRYLKEVLKVKYMNASISDVLNITVNEAAELFVNEFEILRKLQLLQEVGLGYIGLGQSTSTLSGGEAQRLKLAKELMRVKNNKSLYLFDEPTRGLHPDDVNRLIRVFDSLVKRGCSVIAIEHNQEMIKASDISLELGPEGGINGGKIIRIS